MKVLRPQLTLEQVMRLPDPIIPHPYREIEVSRPDPNMFLEHEDGVTEHNTEIHNHVIHNYEQRQAAMESGVPLDILQGIQNAAQSMANSAELFAAGSPEGIPSGVPVISLPEMDHGGRRQLIQELKQHHTEVMERHARQMHASLGEAVQKMAQNAAEIQAKKEYAAQHEAMMKPFQSMHQTHLDAMTQLMGALQQQQSQNAANAAQGAENHAASLLLQKLLAQQGDALAELIGRTGNVSDAGVPEAMRKAASDQTFRDAQLAAYLTNQGQMLGDALQRVAKPQPQAEVDYEKIGKNTQEAVDKAMAIHMWNQQIAPEPEDKKPKKVDENRPGSSGDPAPDDTGGLRDNVYPSVPSNPVPSIQPISGIMQMPLPFEFGAADTAASGAADTAAGARILAQDPRSAAKLAQSISQRYGDREKAYKEGPFRDGERARVGAEKAAKSQQKAAREATQESRRLVPEESEEPRKLSQVARAKLKRQGAKQTAFLNPEIKRREEAEKKRQQENARLRVIKGGTVKIPLRTARERATSRREYARALQEY